VRAFVWLATKQVAMFAAVFGCGCFVGSEFLGARGDAATFAWGLLFWVWYRVGASHRATARAMGEWEERTLERRLRDLDDRLTRVDFEMAYAFEKLGLERVPLEYFKRGEGE
jgi:hypothetical protein